MENQAAKRAVTAADQAEAIKEAVTVVAVTRAVARR
jgi:hypothetical protein